MKKIFILTTLLVSVSNIALASAAQLTVVNSHNCAKAKGISKPFMLILYRGESMFDAVIKCANDAKLSGASFTGLGAIKNPTLNYFNFETKKYQDKTFEGDYELVSLNGGIAQSNNKRVAHMHATLGDAEYKVFGGHLSHAIVAATAEITIIPFRGKLVRKLDEDIGAALISTKS